MYAEIVAAVQGTKTALDLVKATNGLSNYSELLGAVTAVWSWSCPSGAGARVELQTLYVQAHFVGHGIGWALLQAAQGKAQEQSSSPLWLTVNSKNARALAFYARQGYTKVGITYFVLGDGWSCPNSPDTLTFLNKVIGFNDIGI
jgi:ribosomal protein S18 acetylase RimI-like enzyme